MVTSGVGHTGGPGRRSRGPTGRRSRKFLIPGVEKAGEERDLREGGKGTTVFFGGNEVPDTFVERAYVLMYFDIKIRAHVLVIAHFYHLPTQ